MLADGPQSVTGPSPGPSSARVLRDTYRLYEELGAGAMGTLYRGQHLRLGRPVAIKMMSRELAADPAGLARFQREAELLSQLHHPNVVQILDFDVTSDGEPFLVMELLTGETLEDRLLRAPRLELDRAVHIVWQIASALACAHSAGIIHRDLKPENVFLQTATGHVDFVKLLDFGIGKAGQGGPRITRQLEVIGTPYYMAPEQAMAQKVDHRADQFALGCITYRMLTGALPFAGDSLGEVLTRVVTKEPIPVEQLVRSPPAGLGAVVGRAMTKDAAGRFDSVNEFAQALASVAGGARPIAFSSAPPPQLDSAKATSPVPSPSKATVPAPRSGFVARRASPAGEPRPPIEDLRVETVPGAPRADLTPEQAFVLSRIDAPLTLADLLDVTPFRVDEALYLLAALEEKGLVRIF